MDFDAEILSAIDSGERRGLESLVGGQRKVFAISEAETYCDKDGIEGLIARYGIHSMRAFAEAFEAIGATQIANALLELDSDGPVDEHLLARANTLITGREGYTSESLRVLVQCLSAGEPTT